MMKRLFNGGLAFLCLILVHVQTINAQEGIDTDKLDTFFTELLDYEKFMGSVVIIQGDDIIFQNAYGFVDEDQTPAHTNHIYRIGSITKSYTAALILMLQEEGKLNLSDTIETTYPEIPNADKITIEQLLRHKSGLFNFTNSPVYSEYYEQDVSKQEMIDRFIEYGTNFEPGEDFEYSNTGYVLLGYILEDILEMDFNDILRTYITEPLGLNRTYVSERVSAESGEVHSFTYGQGWNLAPQTNMYIPHAAGAISSTPLEVAQFYQHLFSGDLLSEESMEQMVELQDNFGLGVFKIPFYDKTAWGHNGGIDGFQSSAGYFKDEDVAFALLGNGSNYSINEILIGMLSVTFGVDFDIPDFEAMAETIELSEEEMEAYTGTFSSEMFPMDIEIFIQNGNLMAQATGQGAFPLTVNSHTVMSFEPAGIVLEFDELRGHKYRAMELRQAGQQFRFSLD